MASLIVKPRSRILHGHEWVYASDILKVIGEPKPGDVISLKDVRNRPLGSAIYNSNSQIVARRFCRQRQDLDLDFFVRRIGLSIRYREEKKITQPCRLVWSESDGLPGLIVDQYADVLVVQTLTAGMDQRLDLITEALVKLVTPRAVIERNDAPIRNAEGLPPRTGLLHGSLEGPVKIVIDGIEFEIDPLQGHKTGFYLDQIGSYRDVAKLAEGKRVLDCFANQGAFALLRPERVRNR